MQVTYESVDFVVVLKDIASRDNKKPQPVMTQPRGDGILSGGSRPMILLQAIMHHAAPYQRVTFSFVPLFVLKALVVQSLYAT